MDGQENPYTQIWSAKFQEVQKYLSVTGHVYTPAYALVSEQHYAALPEDVRSVLDQCGQETRPLSTKPPPRWKTNLPNRLKEGASAWNRPDRNTFFPASKPATGNLPEGAEAGREC